MKANVTWPPKAPHDTSSLPTKVGRSTYLYADTTTTGFLDVVNGLKAVMTTTDFRINANLLIKIQNMSGFWFDVFVGFRVVYQWRISCDGESRCHYGYYIS